MRESGVISNPGAQELIQAEDLLIVLGTREQLARLEGIAAGI